MTWETFNLAVQVANVVVLDAVIVFQWRQERTVSKLERHYGIHPEPRIEAR